MCNKTQTNTNFWHNSRYPLMILAPMEDVTDTVFRELILRISEPDKLHVVFTEFTSTDGLCHPVGRKKVEERLTISPSEREWLQRSGVKIVAQIWGNNPERFSEAVRYISQNFSFDGIDINMGCPVRNVVKQGCCSALIDNEILAGEIIAATKESTELPLSVKTRLGVKKIDTQRWIRFLLGQPLDALILHGRIQKQMSEGHANWDEISMGVKLRNELNPKIKFIGNGDIMSLNEANLKNDMYGTDGIMVGRGIFSNPWLFHTNKSDITISERLETLLWHLNQYENVWGTQKPFVILRRFFKIYINNFIGASELRKQLMKAGSYDEVRKVLACYNERRKHNNGVLI